MACKLVVTYEGEVVKHEGEILTVAGDYGWKRCDNDADYCRIPAAQQPTTDIAFLHTGIPARNSKLVKCYLASCTLNGAIPECIIEPTDTPAVCTDPATIEEDWSDAAAHPCLFVPYTGGSASINYGSGYVQLISVYAWGTICDLESLEPAVGTTADFSYQVKLYAWSRASAGSDYLFLGVSHSSSTGGPYFSVYVQYNRGGSGKWEVFDNNFANPQDLTGATYVLLRVRRVNGTQYEECNIDGGGWTTLRSYANTAHVQKSGFGAWNGCQGKFTDWEHVA